MGVWLGLEVNLFRVLPLLLGGASSGEVESCVKYFVIQVIGSGLILLAALIGVGCWGYFVVGAIVERDFVLWVILVGLMLKIGVAPFHF